MTSLDTHAYDAKWRDQLNDTNAADDNFFASTLMQDCLLNVCIQRTSWPESVCVQARRWYDQIRNNCDRSNVDIANQVEALDILKRIERIIHHRLSIEDAIAEASIEDIDDICKTYSLLKTGDCLDFDEPDDDKYPLVIDHSDLYERVCAANNSIIDSYIEQLADVQNGSCPQGRTTRLFQIYRSFY